MEGKTMGTTYHITYLDSAGSNYQKEVDSVLVVVNNSMSTYIPTSLISQFNQMEGVGRMNVDIHFRKVLDLSLDVYTASGRSFDPTVMPLVNLFGFGFENIGVVDSARVDSIVNTIGFMHVSSAMQLDVPEEDAVNKVEKTKANIQLDFSAVAKGYGVDVVGQLLESHGIQNYMVEIGGEVRVRGTNKAGEKWRIGIDKPNESLGEGHQFEAIMQLNNESMATSGNYRKYKEKDGVKYVHTINPKTGWPEINNTLSVSVIAKDCATADAYATAFMVMGVDSAYTIALNDSMLEAYFIYSSVNGELLTKQTPGLDKKLTAVE